jgi:hypothetical protein
VTEIPLVAGGFTAGSHEARDFQSAWYLGGRNATRTFTAFVRATAGLPATP